MIQTIGTTIYLILIIAIAIKTWNVKWDRLPTPYNPPDKYCMQCLIEKTREDYGDFAEVLAKYEDQQSNNQ